MKIAWLWIILLSLSLLSLGFGPAPLTISEIINGLFNNSNEANCLIIQQIRLPRIILAWLLGASLGTAGAALQGLLRNPLAEPGVLGISASAALGAVIALASGIAAFNPWFLPGLAMGGAGLATVLLQFLTRNHASNLNLILAGVALSALAGALTSLILNLASNPVDVQEIVLWLLGSLTDRSFTEVGLCLPFVLIGLSLLFFSAPALDILTLGVDEARSLGVELGRLQTQIIVGTALAVGSCVSVTGTIGFVGLIVPHLMRNFIDERPGALLIPSALGGAILVLVADSALRLLNTSHELMLGVVTALFGAPFFLILILRTRSDFP